MNRELELLLFTTGTEFAVSSERAGVNGFIVDWESKGKSDRQKGHDMEVNTDTPHDVRKLASVVSSPVIVRINAIGSYSEDEIEEALDCGARGLMLPMAQSADEVQRFLEIVDRRARTIVQIETQPLVDSLQDLAQLSWDSAYIGLHDLMLSRKSSSMWQAVLDGTVEAIFRNLEGRNVGFAGATVIGGGYPIRFTSILQELARLGAGLTFLRRSFRSDIRDRDLFAEVQSIRFAWSACQARGREAIQADKNSLWSELSHIVTGGK